MIQRDGDNRQKVTRFSLQDFCEELVRLSALGWRIENSNEGAVRGFVGHYECFMTRDAVDEAMTVDNSHIVPMMADDSHVEPMTEDNQVDNANEGVRKRGRPAKGNQ